ncbi:hypothetical protein M378DRAFT_75278 [Amanita muscaria Koide BX008]|uniref:Spindle pole body component n=1 Tax=Amanita muscaria (strain Koide BX008) TaxID=946122 RepID=A0A0C2XBX5_AMAMK|nr:hypothetical protein M378DRAFT_75278 [Amanita muscaria Koide BX008]
MDFRSFFSNVNDLKIDSFFVPEHTDDVLPELEPLFSIPALPEKPHNPILDSLNGSGNDGIQTNKTSSPPRIRTDILPPELAILTEPSTDPALDHPLGLWHSALLSKRLPENQALFWDKMCSGIQWDKPSSTPFISEQDGLVYSIARHQLQDSLRVTSETDRIYLSQAEFLSALRSTVLGTSSTYHVWDAKQECFVHINATEGRQSCLIVDGKDEVICRSVIQRFLTIGTLLRRLETLLDTLRTRSAQEGPTIHAFSHSMSTILAYLRDEISRCSTDAAVQNQHLSATWAQYALYEEILVALSSFYGRSEHVSPENYPLLESTPIPLLNSIHNELELHIERHSPRILKSIFAFMLTNTCQDYLREISHTVGYGVVYVKKSTRVVGELPDQYGTDGIKEEEETNDIFEAIQKLGTEFPSFFPSELVGVLPAAQKSLVLLQEAQPEHPVLVTPEGQELIHWFWTEDETSAAWNQAVGKPWTHGLGSQPKMEEGAQTSILYKPELAEFRIFDQEPGFYDGPSTLKSENIALAAFRAFVDKFPDELPSITPTLSRLSSLVFSRLVEHASKLSNTLLSVFLSSGGNLNLRAHLELLRSFLLVTSPAFESRLSAALFSDAEEYELDTKSNRMSFHSLRRRRTRKVVTGTQPWAVGLAPALLEDETWPPEGTDLGFSLRTVIVDSIGRSADESADERDKVSEEAEYRLGFAIRDLPAGSGKEKWLNPLCTALDFLYMDYKPPRALEILITPEILHKYQRMFAFILRLMRVTHAIKAVYRMSRSSSKPLFETLVNFRKLMLHFRFVADSFISNLSAYVFDTAIGGNFDPFVQRLAATALVASSPSETLSRAVSSTSSAALHLHPGTERFSDVFSLSQSHSELLDNILSACLLRSGQRQVGDILRQALELVLEFSVVIGELHRGRLKEYEAGPMVQDLFSQFRSKMTVFTRVLKELAEKTGGNASTRIVGDEAQEGHRRATGGMEALSHLMIRLDLGEWWTSVG